MISKVQPAVQTYMEQLAYMSRCGRPIRVMWCSTQYVIDKEVDTERIMTRSPAKFIGRLDERLGVLHNQDELMV